MLKVKSTAAHSELSDPDFELLQLQSQIENDEHADRIGSLRTIGRILMQKHRYAEAVPVYESLLSADPSSVQTQETLARCLERLGRWAEAVARYELVLDADPTRADALVGMALCMVRQDRPQTALPLFDRCLALDPSHLGALLGKATCLRLTGNETGAETFYREALRVRPEIESALDALMGGSDSGQITPGRDPQQNHSEIAELENIIAAALSAEDYVTAAEHCRTLTELAPDYSEAWFNLGIFEHRNANWAASAEAFDVAVRHQPLSVEPLQALAESYHLQGALRSAEASYQAALALAPDTTEVLWNLALLLEQRGDFVGAAQKLSRLVKADQDRGEAWFRLGFVRLHAGDHEGAVVAFRRALDLGAKTFESNYNLGLAYWELARVRHPAECFRAVLKIQANFRPAIRALAAVALHDEDFVQARELHRELVESGETSVEIIFNLAVLEHRSNRLHSAVEFYKQALKIDPDLADAAAGVAQAQSTLSARRHK